MAVITIQERDLQQKPIILQLEHDVIHLVQQL